MIERLRELPFGMQIVVDDCSKDGTDEVLRGVGDDVEVIRHEVNQGKGAALRTGFSRARGRVVVVQDADLEYDPADIPSLIAPILEGHADAVYGSRFLISGERRVIYYWHSLANHFLTTACNMAADLNLTDMETCYKAFRLSLARSIPIHSNRFGIEPELTIKFAKRQASIYEVPISYYGRTYDEGKKIGAKDAVSALWVIVRGYSLATSTSTAVRRSWIHWPAPSVSTAGWRTRCVPGWERTCWNWALESATCRSICRGGGRPTWRAISTKSTWRGCAYASAAVRI